MTLTLKIRTLTSLWTGGADGNCDRLHETSIIGSLRWWYEALVRGLGGQACDPTDDSSCPDRREQRCTACELFGCTGWQRKFKLRILEADGELFNQKPGPDGLNSGITMNWQFLELRPLIREERWLLYQAVHIAAEYGAIGGRTPRKPQSNKKVGGDYGLIVIDEYKGVPEITKRQAETFLKRSEFRRQIKSHSKWPDLRWFFFVNGEYLWRKQINALIGLSENGKKEISSKPIEQALRGRVGVSKKVFSFETPPGRLWGYLPDLQRRDATIKRLTQLGIDKAKIKTGEEVLNEL